MRVTAAQQVRIITHTDEREYIGRRVDAEQLALMNELIADGRHFAIVDALPSQWRPYTHTVKFVAHEGLPAVLYHARLDDVFAGLDRPRPPESGVIVCYAIDTAETGADKAVIVVRANNGTFHILEQAAAEVREAFGAIQTVTNRNLIGHRVEFGYDDAPVEVTEPGALTDLPYGLGGYLRHKDGLVSYICSWCTESFVAPDGKAEMTCSICLGLFHDAACYDHHMGKHEDAGDVERDHEGNVVDEPPAAARAEG